MNPFTIACRRAAGLLAVLCLVLLGAVGVAQARGDEPAPARGTAQPALDEERWYRVMMMEAHAGFLHVRVTHDDAGQITTASRMRFTIGRADQAITQDVEGAFVETSDGKPVSMFNRRTTGQMELEQRFVFEPDAIRVTTLQAGRESVSAIPLPEGEWLAPAAAERRGLELYRAGERDITLRVMDPMGGAVAVDARRTGFTPVTIEIDGEKVEGLLTIVRSSILPGVETREVVSLDGEMLRSETALGPLTMVVERTTREGAQPPAGGVDIPEVMVTTMVKPSRPIERPREMIEARYTLRTTHGADAAGEPTPLPDLPTGAAQEFTRTGPGSGTLVVRAGADRAIPAELTPAQRDRYLASTAMAGSDDERIVRFVRSTLGAPGKLVPAIAAERLRRAVHAHIDEKSLGVGMGSATEVIRTREGDCTEHAVLLVAALRAAGIPARAATGLVYVEEFGDERNVFGYHMWAQALLPLEGGEGGGAVAWVDLDPTFPDDLPFDATHITLATSDLDDSGGVRALLSVGTVMGRLAIDVDDVVHAQPAGRTK